MTAPHKAKLYDSRSAANLAELTALITKRSPMRPRASPSAIFGPKPKRHQGSRHEY